MTFKKKKKRNNATVILGGKVLVYVVPKTTDIQSWISWAKYRGPLFSFLGMSIFALFTSISR